MTRLAASAIAVLLLALSLSAQDIISARAGYVNYREGRTSVPKRQLERGETFRNDIGRTELLLTPGSFLRLDHNSTIRMVSNRLSDVQVEVVEGTVGVEVAELPKQSRITLLWADRQFPIERRGLYRFRADDGVLRVAVYDGKLRLAGSDTTLKKGQWVEFTAGGITAPVRFDRRSIDPFDTWSRDRAAVLAAASYRSANAFNRRGYSFRNSLWAYSPFLDCYTFLPYSAYITSPWAFGIRGWSPWDFNYYSPRYIWIRSPGYGGQGGGSGVPGTGAGGGGGYAGASQPPPTQVAAPRYDVGRGEQRAAPRTDSPRSGGERSPVDRPRPQ